MAFSILVFRAQLDGLLVTTANNELTDIQRDRNIKAALERYSRDKPDEITSDVTGDAGKYYAINTTNLPSWVEGWSQVVKIEYPAATVSSDEAPTYLDPEDWDDDYWDASGASPVRYLYLPNHAPAATETLRIRYTAPYLWTASSITEAVAKTAHGFSVNDYLYKENLTWYEATDSRIATHQVTAVADVDNYTRAVLEADPPAQDFFAICKLAASFCCRAIATRYSRTTDSTISADSVDHLSRAQQFALRADEYMEEYEEHMGISAGEGGLREMPAGEFVDWDTAPSWPTNRRFLFHGPETR